MKKVYSTPSIEEIDFRDTAASCGAASRMIKHSSGFTVLDSSPKCFSLNNWLFNWNTGFTDDAEEIYDEEENE